jgi:hypothetical protein
LEKRNRRRRDARVYENRNRAEEKDEPPVFRAVPLETQPSEV